MKKTARIVDEIDRKILTILQESARISTKQIAQRIGNISKVAVAYRIRRMVREGIIIGFTTKLNADKLGREFCVAIRISSHRDSPFRAEELSIKIAKMAAVQSVYRMFGHYDLLVLARCKDKESARDLIYNIYNLGGVRFTDTSIVHTVTKESLDLNLFEEEHERDFSNELIKIQDNALSSKNI